MSDADANPRPRRWGILWVVAASALLVLVALALAYLSTAHFNSFLRQQFIANLQRVTGGQVQVGSFRWRLSRLELDLHDVSVRRPEVYGRAAYIHIERLQAQLKLQTLVKGQLAFSSLRLERPYFQLITNAAGTEPRPVITAAGGSSIQELFSVATDRLEVIRGELQFNDKRIPLDLTADDVDATATHFVGPERYEGQLRAGKIDTVFEHWRPIASTASVQFTLLADRLDFTSVQTSGESRLVSNGRITDFNNPRVELTYHTTLQLAQASAIVRSGIPVSGRIQADGQGTYTKDGYHTSGRLRIADGSYGGAGLRVRNVQLASSYKIDNDVLTLSGLTASLLGGSATGDVQVVKWNSLDANVPEQDRQRGAARLRIERVSVTQLADAITTRKLPVAKLQLAGAATGNLEARWTGSPEFSELRLNLTSAAPAQPRPGQLPVSGHLRGVYRAAAHTLQVDELSVATRAIDVKASGILGATKTNLTLAVESTDLQEFEPALSRLHVSRELPLRIHGRASFDGTASGMISDPLLAGHLDLSNFETQLRPATQPAGTARVRELHWDHLAADIELSSHLASASHGTLRRGGAELQFSFRAGLNHYAYSETSPVMAQAKLSNASLADVQALAGTAYPVSGILNFSFQAQGTRLNPNGQGRLEVTRAHIYGEAFERISANLRFDQHEALLQNLQLLHRQTTISGEARYNFQSTEFAFNVRSTNLDLARLQRIQQPKLPIAGKLSFTAEGSGTRAAPHIVSHVVLRDLVVGGEREGRFLADVVSRGRDLVISGHSDFEHADLAVDGVVGMQADMPAQVTLRFRRLDIDPLLHAYLRGRVTAHSSSEGTVQISGPLAHPRMWNGSVDLSQFSAELENVRIQNDGPIRAAMRGRLLSIQSFRLVGEGTDISATGTAQLLEPWRVSLRADGHINMKILQSLNPDYMSYGMVTVAMRVGGTIGSPDFEGELQIAHGGISYIDLPSGLSEINGTLTFNRDRLSVRSLTAKTGGGNLDLGGYITYGRKINFDLTARGHEVRLRYPPGVSSTANLDLHLAGSLASSVLAGDILITRFGLNPNFDFAVYLARAKQATPLTPANSPLSNLKLDVHVTSTPELQVQTSSAKLSGDVDLRLRGTGTHPAVLGRVNITQGQVSFNGTKYELERGDITFTNPVSIEPVFDLEAMARVRDYDITLGFHGPIDKLSTTYSSDPPLPTADIIALLAVGRTREESAMLQSQTTENFVQSTSNAILGQALNQAVSNRLERLFGVSRIKIDPEAGGAENNTSGTRVTVEQQVSNNVTLTYITNVSQAQQQIIQAEYYITKNLSIIAVRDQNGVLGVDVRIRRRKK